MRRRVDLPSLRAALWTVGALREVHRGLARGGIETARVSPPPELPRAAGRGVMAVLRRRPSTCLERALVLQRWATAQGAPATVVIGVDGGRDSFRAHAWIEELPDDIAASFHEILRLPAPLP
jgi:Transglutaminase-like superfamily